MSAIASSRRLIRANVREMFLVAAVVFWVVWVLLTPVWTGLPVPADSYYLTAPAFLLLGVLLGRVGAAARRAWLLPEVLVLVSVVVAMIPMYGNAVGAVGVQVLALGALLAMKYLPNEEGRSRAWTLAVLVLLVLLAGMLVRRSDAAALLSAPLVVLCVLLVAGARAPLRRRTVAAATTLLAWGGLVVVWLGTRDSWPEWLSASTVLSKSRHTLWADALQLWQEHPVTGGGVGSFTASSELASSTSDLAMAHSSLLQVGSELGLIGVALFLLVATCALRVVLKGSRPAAAVAVGAWTALGIHSLIDHLFEFPAVAVLIGAVLGMASVSRSPRADPRVVDESLIG